MILLDVGLPKLNGIETARRIRYLVPQSRILFLSQHQSPEILVAALSAGASGYVVKPDAGDELLLAIEAVLQGKRFVSARLAGHPCISTSDGHVGDHPHGKEVLPRLLPRDM
jgi:DNA-binding NarL/FixJ family response regulator